MSTPYAGERITFLTQHGKESLVRPVLEPVAGCHIEHVSGYDTDLLGTFSRDIDRCGTQIEAARRKARIGMELGGSSIGIASEGAFVPDPYSGFLPWNIELLLLIDDARKIEILGVAQGAAQSAYRMIGDTPALQKFALEAGFPKHQLMLRPNHADDPRIRKGLADWMSLQAAFDAALDESDNGLVFVENDLRAFCNPTRQSLIRAAAEDLTRKILSACPSCSMPGFSASTHRQGLACGGCGLPTRMPVADIWTCAGCGHEEERLRAGKRRADPSECGFCNP